MLTILEFFGGSLLSPAFALRLKLMLIAAAAMAALCLGLTTWALLERSGRLSLKVDVVRLEDQVKILSAALKRQSVAILDHAAIGNAIRADIRGELDRLAAAAGKRDPVLLELEALIRKGSKRPDGTAADCRDAWREFERRARP